MELSVVLLAIANLVALVVYLRRKPKAYYTFEIHKISTRYHIFGRKMKGGVVLASGWNYVCSLPISDNLGDTFAAMFKATRYTGDGFHTLEGAKAFVEQELLPYFTGGTFRTNSLVAKYSTDKKSIPAKDLDDIEYTLIGRMVNARNNGKLEEEELLLSELIRIQNERGDAR